MADWEPKPSERTYYRSRADGQRAYLVKRDGVDCLRLDRPMEAIYQKLGPDWAPDVQKHSANPYQVAKVAFIADRALCSVIGEYIEAKDEWLNLKEDKRIDFMDNGPCDDGIRDELFKAISKCLRKLTDG